MFIRQAKKNGLGSIEMEKHEAVVSGIMSSIGFDTLQLSEQTTKAGTIAPIMPNALCCYAYIHSM